MNRNYELTNMDYKPTMFRAFISSAFLLYLVHLASPTNAQIFSQHFDLSEDLSFYYDLSNPNENQFNSIGASGMTVEIASGKLKFVRTGTTESAANYARTSNLAVQSEFMCFSFDLTVDSIVTPATTAAQIQVGNNFSTTSSSEDIASIHSRIGINFNADSSFSIRDVRAGTSGPNSYHGEQKVRWYINNSGRTQSYTAPDGSVESLANNRWDLWVGVTKEFNDRQAQTAGVPLDNFKFIYRVGTAIIQFDSIEIYDLLEANIAVDLHARMGKLPRYEGNFSVRGELGVNDKIHLNELNPSIVRDFIFINGGNNPSEGNYSFGTIDSNLDTSLGWADADVCLTIAGTPNWNRDTSYGSVTLAPPVDFVKYQQTIKDFILHYKTRFPRLKYVGAWNEPDLLRPNMLQVVPKEVYAEIYNAFALAVDEVNAGLSETELKIRVGGPSIASSLSNRAYCWYLMDYCKANALTLDFIDIHSYRFIENPRELRIYSDEIRDSLTAKGIAGVSIMHSEYGTIPGGNDTNPSIGNMLRQAAWISQVNYFFTDTPSVELPIHWQTRHNTNYVKSMLVTDTSETPVDGKVYPYFNYLKARSLMKDTLVMSLSDRLTAQGIGVSGLASISGDSITMILTNYQGNEGQRYNVTARIDSLPPNFAGKNLVVKQYLIDEQHSNYLVNPLQDQLELFSIDTIAVDTSVHATIRLNRNSITLLVLSVASEGGSHSENTRNHKNQVESVLDVKRYAKR